MKKLFTILAIACSFALVSCEDDGFLNNILDEVFGEATLNMTIGGTDGYTFNFSSCVNDIIIGDSLDENIDYRGMYNTFMMGATINLTDSAMANMPYPMVAMKLNDVTAKTYQFDTVLTPIMLNDGFDFRSLIANASNTNLFVVAENDSSWYWGIHGSFEVTGDYPAEPGEMLIGNFNNIQAFHVTQWAIDSIAAIYNHCLEIGDNTTFQNLRLEDFFPIVTFNGNVESMKLNIENLINSLKTE